MKVYVGSDHRGYILKTALVEWLKNNGFEYEDLGAHEYNDTDDYPIFASNVARAVAKDPRGRGVVLCGSGAGVDIVANKTNGIRSCLAINTEQIVQARQDDNINVLAVASDYTDQEKLTEYVEAFLKTDYIENAKHERRLEEIENLEKT